MNSFTDESESKTSKYNAAVAQLFRIDSLWQSSHIHSRSGQFFKWNHDLDCVWKELAADAKPEYYKKMDTFKKLWVKYRTSPNMLNQILMAKEICLRTLQNEQGKGTAYADSSEDDFE